MCGIAGYFDYEGKGFVVNAAILDRMTDALRHRGPDGRGIWQGSRVGLGHRRLAIIDLSAAGAQPMASADGNIQITFNGEIYNYRELRRELEGLGHQFRSHSDTEVIIEAYRAWGRDCVKRFNGIFAFAIWDQLAKRLWLARDPLGVKPLFFSQCQGFLLFASEISSLFQFPGLSQTPDYLGLDSFFSFGYTVAPRTGYACVQQLLPGQTLTVEDQQLYFKKYWDINLTVEKLKGHPRDLTVAFEEKLRQAVERQMVADVNLGAFLSSGVDSFAVVRAMQKINHGQTKTFSIGFRQRTFDELPDTRLAATALDVDLYSEYFENDCTRLLSQVIQHTLEPLADSSCLPMYLLCQMTAKKVKVALSGDGADELLAGYPTYRATQMAKIFRCIPGLIRQGLINPLAQLIPQTGHRYSLSEKTQRFLYGSHQGPWRDHAAWRVIFRREDKKKFYAPEFWHAVKDHDPLEAYAQPIRRAKACGLADLDAMLYADTTFYLPNDMLAKVDRMSMAHGLEVRVPFLDQDLVEFAWRLPTALKSQGARGKVILRKVISDCYPAALQKLSKRGFNVPDTVREEQIRVSENLINQKVLAQENIKTMGLDRYQYYALQVLNGTLIH